MEQAVEVQCPSCGEPTTLWVDAPEGRSRMATDCEVCCRPLHVVVEVRRGRVVRAESAPGW